MINIKNSKSILLDGGLNLDKHLGDELFEHVAILVAEQLAAHLDAGRIAGINRSIDVINKAIKNIDDLDINTLRCYNKCVEFLSVELRKEIENLPITNPITKLQLPWF